MEDDWIKNTLEETVLIQVLMIGAHPHTATQSISSLINHNQARNMDAFHKDLQFEFQQTDLHKQLVQTGCF